MRALTLTCAALAAAQKDVKFYPATITFTDSPTTSSLVDNVRLTSDGAGTYTGATTVTADSGNLTIDLSRSSRRFRVTLKDGTAYAGPLPAGIGPGQDGATCITGKEAVYVYGSSTWATWAFDGIRQCRDAGNAERRTRRAPKVEGPRLPTGDCRDN